MQAPAKSAFFIIRVGRISGVPGAGFVRAPCGSPVAGLAGIKARGRLRPFPIAAGDFI